MTQPVSRKWWLALSIAAALASAPAFAAKDVVVAVGSNFTTLDPYDANDTLYAGGGEVLLSRPVRP